MGKPKIQVAPLFKTIKINYSMEILGMFGYKLCYIAELII